jgi:single-strand DNA-binding protein
VGRIGGMSRLREGGHDSRWKRLRPPKFPASFSRCRTILPSRARGRSETCPRSVLKFEAMASRSVNKVILVGHLGKDAETKFTPSGVACTKFSIATNRRWKDQQSGEWKEETDWANVVLWRQENVGNYLTKGKQVYVEGRLQTRSWDDKDGKKQYMTEVVADEVILLGGRGDSGGGSAAGGDSNQQPVSMPRSAAPQKPKPAPAAEDTSFDQGITDDDVPF